MKLFFYDLETTGTKFWKNGIHQISGIIDIDGVIKESFDYKVRPNPSAVIEDEALEIGGVTREQIMAYPPMEEVYSEIKTMLARYVNKYDKKDKFFLSGFNILSFDNQFFRAFFKQNGDDYFGSWFWADCHDVYTLASYRLRRERVSMENFKLKTVAKQLGFTVDESRLHDAAYDNSITRDIYYTL